MTAGAPFSWKMVCTLTASFSESRLTDQVLETHHELLETHRRYLSTLHADAQNVPDRAGLLQECLRQTDQLSQNFRQLTSTFFPAHGSQLPSGSRAGLDELNGTTKTASNSKPQSVSESELNGASRQQPAPPDPRVDPSGLFMTDTIPTPVDELLRRSVPFTSAVIRTKRKVSGSDHAAADHSDGSPQDRQRPVKKLRVSQDQPHGSETENVAVEPELIFEQPLENPPAADTFVEEVEARLRRKNLKRQRKKDKKRKRESGTSDISMTGTTQDAESSSVTIGKPNRKKRKQSPSSLTNTTSTASQSAERSGSATPQVENPEKKRASPAAQYIESILHQGTGRGKRLRKNRSEMT
jgi:hypothetical protein